MKIKEDLENAYVLTNIGNSIALVTDGSGYAQRQHPQWHQLAAVPCLEATSLFYKRIANIDAQPFILSEDCRSVDQYRAVVRALQGGVAGLVLYNMASEHESRLLASLDFELRCFVLSSAEKNAISGRLAQSQLADKVNDKFFIAILSRALLDTLYRGRVSQRLQELLLENIQPPLFRDNPLSYLYNHSLQIYRSLVEFIFREGLSHTRLRPETLVRRFQNFLTLGGKSWFTALDIGYAKTDSLSALSLQLHEK